jgi:hypothetical protein
MKGHVEGVLWPLSIATLLVAGLGRSRLLLLILAILWAVSTSIVIPVHFYRAWKRWERVSNRRDYATWVGFETVTAIVLISLGIYAVISK